MPLCSVCRAAFNEPDYPRDVITTAVDAILSAANAGCYVCFHIKQELLTAPKKGTTSLDPATQVELNYSRFADDATHFSCFALYLSGFSGWETWSSLNFRLYPLDALLSSTRICTDASYWAKRENPAKRLRSIQTLISAWMMECKLNHRICEQSFATWCPTRLLEVGASENCRVKLVETEAGSNHRYVTLSHRWLSGKVIKLMHNNKKTFEQEIDTSVLSKTFRDAITITRVLGSRYLWVDSICIIQDDQRDWQRESSKMHQIYFHAVCNLSAVGTSSVTDGLLFAGEAEGEKPCTLDVNWESIGAGTYILALQNQLELARLDSAPLNQRSWVLQERILAPRILHFHRDQIYWECFESRRSETSPQRSLDLDIVGTELKQRVAYLTSEIQNHDLRESRSELYDLWQVLVERYSRCGLTKPKDKLVAISALARRFRSAIRDEYLAGLWRERLLDEFCWRIDVEKTEQLGITISRPQRYRAPSWSWAAVDGPVVFRPLTGRTDYPLDTEVVDSKIQPVSKKNSTGLLISATLRLRGQVLSFGRKLETGKAPDAVTVLIEVRKTLYEFSECCIDTPPHMRSPLKLKGEWVLLLLLGSSAHSDPAQVEGLILEPTKDVLMTSEYRRVGVFAALQTTNPPKKSALFAEPLAQIGESDDEVVLV